MARSNREIADLFENVADLLQLKGESIHRVLAYRNAAESIRELPRDLHAIAAEGKLQDIPNIGATLAEKITELLTTDHLVFFEKLTAEIPVSLIAVLRVNGIGPKRAMQFYKELGLSSVAEVEAAAKAGKLRELSGMGAKSEQKVLDGIAALARRSDRVRIDVAMTAAEAILTDLLQLPQSLHGDIAGSLRRGRSTIGDLDLLIASETAAPIMDAFVSRADVARILGHGPTKSSVELLNGLQCDLRVLPPGQYGTALVYFTGSQAHNIRLRELAQQMGLSLNESAFTQLNGSAPIQCESEEQVYQTLGLAWVPPELREDRGEIEAAQNKTLPQLITQQDIHADFHLHTVWSDGHLTVRQLAETARARGLSHIVVTDHSVSLGVANGLSIERLRAQREEIRAVDAEMSQLTPPLRVFQGTEMEIKTDGTLDFPDEVLAELDVVVASLHSGLRQDRAQVTQRLLTAIRNPHVDIIGHPRGQLIPDREGADLDMDAIFAAAAETGTAMEINANPHRLDLDDVHARRAVALGVKLTIDTDAHSATDFDLLRYGISTARRGWVRATDVINTLPTADFLRWLNGD
jgi:DNA polymerase (family 10)